MVLEGDGWVDHLAAQMLSPLFHKRLPFTGGASRGSHSARALPLPFVHSSH